MRSAIPWSLYWDKSARAAHLGTDRQHGKAGQQHDHEAERRGVTDRGEKGDGGEGQDAEEDARQTTDVIPEPARLTLEVLVVGFVGADDYLSRPP